MSYHCIAGLQNKIVFSAKLPNSIAASVKNSVLQYNQVITNIGGAYDITDCVFTAPIDGYYVFFWSVTQSHQNNRQYTQTAITKNGAEIVRDSAFAPYWLGSC